MQFETIKTGKALNKRAIQALLDDMDKIKKQKGLTQVWYRGHSDETYKLVPSIGREFEYNGESMKGFSHRKEIALLNRFMLRAYPYVGRIANKWEALFLARHHELPTRLLD